MRGELLCTLIERRCGELDLNPPIFVHRLGYENITRTYSYLKNFDEDVQTHPIPEPTVDALSRALELPVERVRSAASESYKRLSKSWGTGLIPHANIILHPDERPGHGFILLLRRVDTRIDFKPNSRPKTFVKQAVEALRERNLKRRKFHSLVVNYAWGQAVRVDADGNEIERLGDEEPK